MPERIMKEDSIYASKKLAEIEFRAHFVHKLHGAYSMVKANGWFLPALILSSLLSA